MMSFRENCTKSITTTFEALQVHKYKHLLNLHVNPHTHTYLINSLFLIYGFNIASIGVPFKQHITWRHSVKKVAALWQL